MVLIAVVVIVAVLIVLLSCSSSSGSSDDGNIINIFESFSIYLIDVTTPENIEFLSSLDRGDVPKELQQQRKPGENRMTAVDVTLDDRRGEDYVPPPAPAYIAFSGSIRLLAI